MKIKLLIVVAFLVQSFSVKAVDPSASFYIDNPLYISPGIYEFDVVVKASGATSSFDLRTFQAGIYVNPAWNIGVFHSECENICLLSDDIDFNINVFEFISNQFKSENVKIIGCSKLSYTLDKDLEFTIEQISIRNRGWGCLIFVKKSAYTWIPNDLKIHFGDDFLIKQLSGYVWRLNGLKIDSNISESINSNSEFHKIIEEDNKNSIKYGLPWSNDY